MRRSDKVSVKPFVAAAVLVGSTLIGAQQQTSNTRSGWPCGARLDPSYFQVAEGTGGHLLLLAPEEIGDSATLLTAVGSHPQTIFRLAGSLRPGVHELQVPIDPSVESVIFSISVQCLQVAHLVRPSGLPASGDSVTDLSNFRAQRMVIVARPETGIWTIRVLGKRRVRGRGAGTQRDRDLAGSVRTGWQHHLHRAFLRWVSRMS